MKNQRLIAVVVLVLSLGTTIFLLLLTLNTGSIEPFFVVAPCPLELPGGVVDGEEVVCGYLTVPEDRADPQSRIIRLAVALLPTANEDFAPDPVVYLAGGPGASAFSGLEFWLRSPILQNRTLILLEQRGTRYAEPWLSCPEWSEATIENLGQVLSLEQEAANEVEAATLCRERFDEQGINLAAYNSTASAADVEDLRLALGYDSWNLYGGSYGARLALTVMRDHPQGLRSVVLDSVSPPDADRVGPLHAARAFETFFAGCAADPACAATFPDLEATFYALVDGANAEPISLSATHPRAGGMDLLLTGDDIAAGLFQVLYDARTIPNLPALITQLEAGNHAVLATLVETALSRFMILSEGMNFSVQCYEEIPFVRGVLQYAPTVTIESIPPQLQSFQLGFNPAICDVWGVGAAEAFENEPVSSDIPTLVLAGGYDPITQPGAAQRAAETLSQGLYYEFPGLSHGISTTTECGRDIMLAFFDDPNAEPDTGCIDEMGGMTFVTGR